MKTECMYCGKIITNPFIDTGQSGKLYFFCNVNHRDLGQRAMIERALMMNPIGAMCFVWGLAWAYIKHFFKKTKSLGG